MRAAKHTRRSPAHGVSGALLTAGLLTAALLATAVLATSASAPAALTRVTATRVASPGTASPGTAAPGGPHRAGGPPAAPGWRVVKTVGPGSQSVSGMLTVHSAGDAWSVWAGTRLAAVDRLTGNAWTRVALPASLDGYVRSAVASDGDSATDFWLFSSYRMTQALRFNGTRWAVVPIPSWVLRAPAGGGGLSATAAVFGPGNVWVFSLNDGSYAAHYNGRSWARVRLPGTPAEVSAVAANDIWALAGSAALHWNGWTWTSITIPAAAGSPPEGFGNLTAAGPASAWVWRTLLVPGPATHADVLHWNGTRWRRVAATPADIVESVTPDGAGGLWAAGLDVNPGGFSSFYHLAGGRWTRVNTPAGVWNQQNEHLTWIPGTRSLWGTAAGLTAKGPDGGVILKYGP